MNVMYKRFRCHKSECVHFSHCAMVKGQQRTSKRYFWASIVVLFRFVTSSVAKSGGTFLQVKCADYRAGKE